MRQLIKKAGVIGPAHKARCANRKAEGALDPPHNELGPAFNESSVTPGLGTLKWPGRLDLGVCESNRRPQGLK